MGNTKAKGKPQFAGPGDPRQAWRRSIAPSRPHLLAAHRARQGSRDELLEDACLDSIDWPNPVVSLEQESIDQFGAQKQSWFPFWPIGQWVRVFEPNHCPERNHETFQLVNERILIPISRDVVCPFKVILGQRPILGI